MATNPVIATATLGDEVLVTPFQADGRLPLFIQPLDPVLMNDLDRAVAWFEANRPAIEALILDAGAVVLRGFCINTTAAFGRLIEGYDSPAFGYSGGATPRQAIEGRVFEATRAPAEMWLGMHQEMAYLPHYPRWLAFYCRMPSASGGETLIADMRRFTAAVDPAMLQRVIDRGVLYTRNFRSPDVSTGHPTLDASHLTWTGAFYTDDPAKAEADCKAMGLQAEWLDDGSLSVSYRARGYLDHPETGDRLWFNHITTQSMTPENMGERYALHRRHYGTTRPLPYCTTYGDGTPVAPEDLSVLYPTMRKQIVAFPWSHGDVMLLDNYLTAHGRNSYTGKRDVQVALLS